MLGVGCVCVCVCVGGRRMHGNGGRFDMGRGGELEGGYER